MATFKYLLVEGKSPKQTASIYYRFRNGGWFDARRKTPIEIDRKWFRPKHQDVRIDTDLIKQERINKKLRDFKKFFMDEISFANMDGVLINLDWVKRKQNEFFNSNKDNDEYKIYFSKLVEFYKLAENKKGGFLDVLQTDLEGVKIAEMDEQWLNNYKVKEQEKGYSPNYTGKKIHIIKRILKYGSRQGIKIDPFLMEVKTESRKSISIYLNNDELKLLFNNRFDSDTLENTRKLFLIGCLTGLRVSDLMRIKEIPIVKNRLRVITQKTKDPLEIPIDPRIEKFIKEVRPVTRQHFNKTIKEVCKAVGINKPTLGYKPIKHGEERKPKKLGTFPKYELISSHTMRRSFASNLYGILPTSVIRGITGHSSEANLLTYIRLPQEEAAKQLEDYYKNLNKL